MQGIMTILGLYTADNTLFDGVVLPAGMSLETLRINLLAELGELEVLYPSSPFMKEMIKYWAMKEYGVWEKQYATITVQYDMLKNYDITIQEDNDTTSDMHSTNRGTDTTVQKVTAFNSDTSKQAGENTVTLGTGSDGDGHVVGATTRHEYGDASLRTTQDVLKQEREVALYNVYDNIIESFKQRFCIAIW